MDDVFFLDVPLRFWSKSSSRIQHGCIHPWVGLVGSVVTWGFSGLKYEIMNREDLTPPPILILYKTYQRTLKEQLQL